MAALAASFRTSGCSTTTTTSSRPRRAVPRDETGQLGSILGNLPLDGMISETTGRSLVIKRGTRTCRSVAAISTAGGEEKPTGVHLGRAGNRRNEEFGIGMFAANRSLLTTKFSEDREVVSWIEEMKAPHRNLGPACRFGCSFDALQS